MLVGKYVACILISVNVGKYVACILISVNETFGMNCTGRVLACKYHWEIFMRCLQHLSIIPVT
jgi:hypothetical protein